MFTLRLNILTQSIQAAYKLIYVAFVYKSETLLHYLVIKLCSAPRNSISTQFSSDHVIAFAHMTVSHDISWPAYGLLCIKQQGAERHVSVYSLYMEEGVGGGSGYTQTEQMRHCTIYCRTDIRTAASSAIGPQLIWPLDVPHEEFCHLTSPVC